MSIDPKAIERLNRWRHVGDGPTNYTAGSKQFADDVIVALIEIERLREALHKVDESEPEKPSNWCYSREELVEIARAALTSPLCPRPVNSRALGDVAASDCIAAGECGCDLGPVTQPQGGGRS